MKRTPLRSPQGLKAGSLKRKTAPRRSQPKRDWSAAREKVEREGKCRLERDGGCEGKLEAAHTVGRDRDGWGEVRLKENQPILVHPWRIIPLCSRHHRAYDGHECDVLHVLSLDEQRQAVIDADGVENMRVRTAPSCYRTSAHDPEECRCELTERDELGNREVLDPHDCPIHSPGGKSD